MQLIKNDAFITDEWTTLGDDDALPASGPVIVSLERFNTDQNALLARKDKLGIRLKSGQEPTPIADYLDRLDLVALEFPTYRNGRAYSYARMLRDRFGFKGEVRAVGGVLRDQFNYMKRVGFDALEVGDDITPEAYADALATFTYAYQTSADGKTPVLSLRQRLAARAD
tara:strand:+ start:231701 stop:232207 length:507 start_codon:yes stop_codon:yes gene_type:complete